MIYRSWQSWEQAERLLQGIVDSALLQKLGDAFAFAKGCHGDQVRPGGEPYTNHLLQVLEILVSGAEVKDESILIAGLLHDVVEDTPCGPSDIRDRFGDAVADLVDWVTKPKGDVDKVGGHPRYFGNLMTAPLAAKLLKLADRLSNVQRLDLHPDPAFQRRYYVETVANVLPLIPQGSWFEQPYMDWTRAFSYLGAGTDPANGPCQGER
jgi:(p)ppGpp synthase/HD superfamily hydrolase